MVKEVVLEASLPKVSVSNIEPRTNIYMAIRKDGSGDECVYKLDSICERDGSSNLFWKYLWMAVGISHHKIESLRYDSAQDAVSDLLSGGDYVVLEFLSFQDMLNWKGWNEKICNI